uniref:Xylanase inhibitor C-terminal domain-containing protein n=1 Tax=Opuntia streptacantha TaxID=393608 RepID=A0A7C9DGK5_OPUST
MHVAGKKLPIDPSLFDQKHGTLVDGGTTYAYFPEAAFVEFKQAIINELQGIEQIPDPDPLYNDICFSGPESILPTYISEWKGSYNSLGRPYQYLMNGLTGTKDHPIS